MEHYKISKLLSDSSVFKFVTKKWIEINDLSSGQYSVNKSIKFETSMLRSDLCDYSDAYIVVKGTIDLLTAAANENDKVQKNVAFKNNAPFRSCISKINSTLIENAEDLDIVMLIYDLLEHSKNYSVASGTLWKYYRDEIDGTHDNTSDGKSFKYKAKIVGKRPERREQPPQPPQNPDGIQPPLPPQPAVPALNTEAPIPLKYLSNLWRFLNLTLINCEIELDLSWTKDCVLIEHHNSITGATFQMNNADKTLYVPVPVNALCSTC